MGKIASLMCLILIGLVMYSFRPDRPTGPAPVPSASTYAVVPPRAPEPFEKVDLKFLSWEKGGFGSIALVRLQFTNRNDYPVKDISVRCDFNGPSGTRVSSKRETVYISIAPGKSAKSGEINLGFIDQQASGASCDIYDAVQAGAALEAAVEKRKGNPNAAPPPPAPHAKPKDLKRVY